MKAECCRICGGLLKKYSVCAECRESIRQICSNCRIPTEEYFHDCCFRENGAIAIDLPENFLQNHWLKK